MSDLKTIDRIRLEKFFEMQGGYVCDFSHASLAAFVIESIGVDIQEPKYAEGNSGSKANRLRSLWLLESNQRVARLLEELLEYWKSQLAIGIHGYKPFNQFLFDQCKEIAKKLQSHSPIDDIGALTPNSDDKDFAMLAKSIKESIDKGEPEQAIDRLHTFVIKYLREICSAHKIDFEKNMTVNALMGRYSRYIYDNKLIESEMSQKIMSSAVAILESFNHVRNNQSFAHDNPVLNQQESILIFNNISNTIRFIESLEKKISKQKKEEADAVLDTVDINLEDIPF